MLRPQPNFIKRFLGHPDLLKKYDEMLEILNERLYKEAHLAFKGRRAGEYSLYTVRVNREDRILFVCSKILDEECFVLFQEIENHAYKNSVLGDDATIKARLEKIRPALEAQLRDSRKRVIDENKIPKDVKIEVQRVYIHQSKIVVLDAQQEEALITRIPAIITGPAGSGKTLVATQMLFARAENQLLKKPLLYVTESKRLRDATRKCWDEIPGSSQYNDIVEIKTYDDLLREQYDSSFTVFNKRSGREDFYRWFEIYIKENRRHNRVTTSTSIDFDVKDSLKIYQELRNISNCVEEQEYQNYGFKEAIIRNEDKELQAKRRHWVWQFYVAYKKHLHDNKLVHPAFANLALNKEYDIVEIDETQDQTKKQIDNINGIANGQLVSFSDTHQSLDDIRSKRPFMLQMFKKLGLNPQETELPVSYRCPKKILDIANAVLNIEYDLSGGNLDKNSYSFVKAPTESKSLGSVHWIHPGKLSTENLKTFSEVEISKKVVVIISGEADSKQQARQIFPNALILTVSQAKGLEFEAAILFDIFASKAWRAAHKSMPSVAMERELVNRAHKDVISDEYGTLVHELYTACTRVSNKLIIYQDPKNINKIYDRLEKTGALSAWDGTLDSTQASVEELQELKQDLQEQDESMDAEKQIQDKINATKPGETPKVNLSDTEQKLNIKRKNRKKSALVILTEEEKLSNLIKTKDINDITDDIFLRIFKHENVYSLIYNLKMKNGNSLMVNLFYGNLNTNGMKLIEKHMAVVLAAFQDFNKIVKDVGGNEKTLLNYLLSSSEMLKQLRATLNIKNIAAYLPANTLSGPVDATSILFKLALDTDGKAVLHHMLQNERIRANFTPEMLYTEVAGTTVFDLLLLGHEVGTRPLNCLLKKENFFKLPNNFFSNINLLRQRFHRLATYDIRYLLRYLDNNPKLCEMPIDFWDAKPESKSILYQLFIRNLSNSLIFLMELTARNPALYKPLIQTYIAHLARISERKSISVLLEHGKSLNDKPYQPSELVRACQDEDLEKVESLLLNDSTDLNAGRAFGATPLCIALEHHNYKLMKLLLSDDRIDPQFNCNNSEEYPLLLAVKAQNLDATKILLDDQRTNPNIISTHVNATPLILALQTDKPNLDIVDLLLKDKRTDPNLKGGGNTAIHSAIARNHFTCFMRIVNHPKFIPTILDSNNYSPLLLAISENRLQMASILLDAEKEFCQKPGNVGTLDRVFSIPKNHLYPQSNNSTISDLMDREGKMQATALHVAILTNNFEAVKLLVQHRCAFEVSGCTGDTKNWAYHINNSKVINFLKNRFPDEYASEVFNKIESRP